MSFPEDKLILYKTVLCRRWSANGSCSYKELCDYAHGPDELRRNLNKHYYRAIRCKREDSCQFGDECHFAHNEMEMLFHLDLYKTRVCNYYSPSSRDSCSKGELCSFAHGKDELRPSGWWSRKHKQGEMDNTQKESKNGDGEGDSSNRKLFRRIEEPVEKERTPIRILQHKPFSSSTFNSSGQASSSSSSPEALNGYRSVASSATSPPPVSSSLFSPAPPSSSSAITMSSPANTLHKLESDNAFSELLSNRKVHILNVVDQIVHATVQRTMEEAKSGKKGNVNGVISVNVDLDQCSLEELNKVEIALKKQMELVHQARKKFMRSPSP